MTIEELRNEFQNEDRTDFTIVRRIVMSDTKLLEVPIDNNNNNYVLHYALRYCAPESFIIEIIEKYPSALQQRGSRRHYPLHDACQYYNKYYEIIKKLIDEYPSAVQQVDNWKQYPLHVLVETHWNQ